MSSENQTLKSGISHEAKEKALNLIFCFLLGMTLVVLAGIPALEQVKVVHTITQNEPLITQNQ